MVWASVLVGLVGLVLVVRAVFFPEKPAVQAPTVDVRRGVVRTVITGTGTLEPVRQQNVSFGQAGKLVEINVKVGDRVKAGQVLARIDPGGLRSTAQEALGGLQQAQAILKDAREQNAVQTARNALAAAEQALSDAKNQVSKTVRAGEHVVASDKRQLSFDRQTLERLQRRLEREEATLRRARSLLELAQDTFRAHKCDSLLPPDPVACMADQAAVDEAQAAVDASKPKVDAARDAVSAAKAQVLADEAKLSADENQLALDRANGQKSINDAQAAVVSARDALESETTRRPNTIAQQQGGVTSAQAQVDSAQRDLSDATLISPADGTVVGVNAQVGEIVAVGGQTTPLAPGTDAPQPSTATAVSTAGQAGATGGTAASPFLVLADVSSFQVVAPLAEADAAQVRSGQRADVTFDALPGLTLPATVLAVAPGSTVIQNVTNYLVTLTLGQLDPRLRAGLTANAAIVVAEVRDVLVVPNAAIQRTDGQTFVTVLRDDGTQRRVLVQTGAEGDTTTEVTAGLKPGDRVVLPTVRPRGGQPPPAGPAGGGAGG